MRWKQPEKWGRRSLCRGKVLPEIVAWKFRCSEARIVWGSLIGLRWKGEELEKCWHFSRETVAFRHGQHLGIRMGTDDVHRQPGWWGMVYCGRCDIVGSQYPVQESFSPGIIGNLGTRPRKSPWTRGSSESCTRGEMSPCSRARCALATDSQREGLSCGGSCVKNDARMCCSPSHK